MWSPLGHHLRQVIDEIMRCARITEVSLTLGCDSRIFVASILMHISNVEAAMK